MGVTKSNGWIDMTAKRCGAVGLSTATKHLLDDPRTPQQNKGVVAMWEPTFLQGIVWISWAVIVALVMYGVDDGIRILRDRAGVDGDEEFYVDEAGTEWPYPASDVTPPPYDWEQDGT